MICKGQGHLWSLKELQKKFGTRLENFVELMNEQKLFQTLMELIWFWYKMHDTAF